MSIRALLRGRVAGRRHWRFALAACSTVAAGCMDEKCPTPISALPSFDLGGVAARSRRWGTNPSTPAVAAMWPKIRLEYVFGYTAPPEHVPLWWREIRLLSAAHRNFDPSSPDDRRWTI